MFLKLLSNINYLFYFFCLAFFLLILTYIIYKIFIIEADIYMISEKINKIELEFNNNHKSLSSSKKNSNSINISDIIMNEVFNNKNINNSDINTNNFDINNDNDDNYDNYDNDDINNNKDNNDKDDNKNKNEITIEDIIKEKEEESNNKVIFDLKKEIITNDNESIISNGTQITKKKLQKMNLDKLKEKCNELELSTEGNKAQIIDRIMDEVNKDV